MKLIRPASIDEAALLSSNVVETAPAAYVAGTTYALGATVRVALGTDYSVYASLQNANTGHTPATSPTWWRLSGLTHAAYSATATYAMGDRVIDAAAHKEYESLVDGNAGNALTDATKWLLVGLTNRWAMLDGSVQAQTTNPDLIAVEFSVPGRVDSLALLNVSGSSAHATVTDEVDGVVYDKTVSLVSTSGITDWYAWLFEPVERKSDVIFDDIPPYAGAIIDVSISATGETVAIGELIGGFSKNIGDTQWSPQLGITDFSVKTRDDFGNLTVVERAYLKLATFNINVPSTYVDQLQKLLATYRATPILYIGDPDYASTAVFGFFKSFNLVIAGPDVSLCSLDVEGLT